MGVLETVMYLLPVAAAGLVFFDARKRVSRLATAMWTLGTLATAGLAASAYLLVRPRAAPFWGLGEVAALPAFFVLALAPFTFMIENFARLPDVLFSLKGILALTLLQNVVFAGVPLYVALVKYRQPPAVIGLVSIPSTRTLTIAGVASAAALLGNFVGQNLTIFGVGLVIGQQAASDLILRQEIHLPIFRLLQQLHRPRDVAILAIMVGLIVPVGEELFFRGLTYGALRRLMHRHLAVLASALFFAAAHFELVELLPILILGVVLAFLYEYTGSLVPCMIAHTVNNLAALALFYLTLPAH